MKISYYLSALLLGISLQAAHTESTAAWDEIKREAENQTVYFNAWGGAEAINRYIEWAATEAKQRYNITVNHVKITDAAEVVRRIQTEAQAGRTEQGSVDLIWINGENFKALKDAELLYGPWAEQLPNWAYVDLEKPVQVDFSEPTDGLEAPWGTAQLTFIADRRRLETPPDSAQELLDFAKANSGRITYPKPPNFHGTTFLKQLLSELIEDASVLQHKVDEAAFAEQTQALWDYLDALHAVAWRQGRAFPNSNADMHQMLADGEILISLTFNPNEGANLIESGQLPNSAYSFGFSGGTISNVHFVAIPFNARAKAAAQVFANFLLSPEAQVHKADIAVWGDPSVLALDKLLDKLSEAQQAAMQQQAAGALNEAIPSLPEPHASWVEALETEWLKRYGS